MPVIKSIRNNLTTSTTLVLSSILFISSLTPQENQLCVWEYAYPSCNDGKVLNGYWWRDSVWVPMYPSLDSWFTPSPLHFIGGAVFYAQGVMEANAKYRDFNLTNYIDGVAFMSPADIGLPVWLKKPDGVWEGPFLVVDSSMRGDEYPLVIIRNEALEVGWKTAKRWGMVDDKNQVKIWIMENVEISKINPDYLTQSLPTVNYKQWWLDNLKPATVADLGSPIYIPPRTWRIKGDWKTFESPDPSHCCEVFP